MKSRDPLGLRRALADRLLPMLVAAMALLGSLALGGALAAAGLSARWEGGAAAAIMVQVPPGTDAAAAARRLAALPGVAEATAIDRARMGDLLRPWLGNTESLPLPALVELRLMALHGAEDLAARVQATLPGATVEAHGIWVARLLALAGALQRAAWAVLALVVLVAGMMIVVATRAGLAARRGTIAILHDMGATDGMIAGRFAARLAWLSGLGAAIGAGAAAPVLMLLGGMAAPLVGAAAAPPWIGLSVMPPAAALIAWATAQLTVRQWLRSLP